jgi:protease YdgD
MTLKSISKQFLLKILGRLATAGGFGSLIFSAFVVAQAQLPIQSTGTTIASSFKLSPLPASVPPKALDTPQKPRTERGIQCKPGQPLSECDDRVPMLDPKAPWSAIGRIVMQSKDGKSYQCTATLVAEDIILTNAHCIFDEDTRQVYPSLSFEPNLIGGVLKGKAKIIDWVYGTDFRDKSDPPHPKDWALAKLDQPLGKKFGTIKIRSLPLKVFNEYPDKFTLVGYSFDFPDPNKFPRLTGGAGKTPGVHEGCGITEERSDLVLIHDCDMRGGASGGPIIGWIDKEPYIVAVNSAEYANQRTGFGTRNYATNVKWVEEWLKQQNSAGTKKPS